MGDCESLPSCLRPCRKRDSPLLPREKKLAEEEVKLWSESDMQKFKKQGEDSLLAARLEVLTTGGFLLPSASMPHVNARGEYGAGLAPAFSLSANSGEFCTKRGQACCLGCHARKPGGQVRESDFAELGAKTSAYFKLVKLLVWAYAAAAVRMQSALPSTSQPNFNPPPIISTAPPSPPLPAS
jgi:hypothetical protein